MGRIMRVFIGVAAALLAAAMFGGSAQAAPGKEPRELPPASFTGNQYVDSEGCVFQRAGLGGKTTWVPRVGRDRKPVCGYEPTVTAGAAAASPSAATEVKPSQPAASEATPSTPMATAAPVMKKPAASRPVKVVAKKRKVSSKAAAPKSVALIHRKTVSRDATYCVDRVDTAQRYLLSDGRRVTQCSETAREPGVAYLNGLAIPGLVVSDRAPSAREILRAKGADRGAYKVTYVKGRLTGAGKAAMAAPSAPSPAPAPGYAASYVQVGAFAESANAGRAVAALQGLGLPVSVGGGSRLKVILAGPFASRGEVSRALTLVRQHGYGDAFPTRW